MEIKRSTEEVLERVYLKQGYEKTLNIAKTLLKETERKVAVQRECGIIKGELAEVILSYSLLELQKVLKIPCAVVKGLYVVDDVTRQVTEIDVAFITSRQIYLFECKSYAGKDKKLTDECKLWVSNQERANVYEQNKLHTLTFNKMYGGYTKHGSKPYTMVFFDFSTTPFRDTRSAKYKTLIPALTLDNVLAWLVNDLKSRKVVKVNVKRMVESISINKEIYQQDLVAEHKRQLGY